MVQPLLLLRFRVVGDYRKHELILFRDRVVQRSARQRRNQLLLLRWDDS
jgi:hypothetical protein